MEASWRWQLGRRGGWCSQFSFVPPSLIDRAVTFHQGEALIAGKISPQPALLRFGARISEEGGADVPATWAQAH
jgi:uncharacterized protein